MRRLFLIILLSDSLVAHLHRETLARSAVFRKVFINGNKKLNVVPLEIVEAENLYVCVDSCLKHDKCISINYSASLQQCELLDADRETKQEEDFIVDNKNFEYYDTVVKNLCNERNSCYPCGCWSVEYYRSYCRCNNNKLKTKALTQLAPGPFHGVALDPFTFMQNYYAIQQDVKIIYSRMYNANAWSEAFKNVEIGDIIRFGEDGRLYAVQANYMGILQSVNNQWNVLDLPHTIIDFDVSTTNQYYIANTEKLYVKGNSEELSSILFTRFRVRHGYFFALGKACGCVMRHRRKTETPLNDWEVITTNPGSVVEFSVDVNNIIYAIHNDQHIYEWDDYHDKWIRYYDGPCETFEINNLVMCLTPTKKIQIDISRVPKPYAHIPFKTFNASGLCTPYGRGDDTAGGNTVSLNGNQIALDQFGKEKVLHKVFDSPLTIGSFELSSLANSISKQFLGNALFTVSLWLRIMPQTAACNLLSNHIETTTGFVLRINPTDISFIIYESLNYIVRVTPLNMKHLYYWTHIVLVRNGGVNLIKIFVNGSEIASTRTTYSASQSGNYKLFTLCQYTYINDFAVWFSQLTPKQITNLYESDLSNPGWTHKFSRVIEKSCEELKRQRAYTTSGYYWILLDGVMTSVFCDMVTDGGGWTMVTNYNTEIIGNVPPNESQDYTKISTVNKNNFYLSSQGIGILRNYMDIKEIRLECWKSSHGRKVHVVFTLKAVVDLLTHVSDEQQMTCGSYYKLDDDNAVITKQCAINHINGNLLSLTYGSCRLNLIFDDPYKAAVSLNSQVCDDMNVHTAGIWRYYVR